MALTVQVPVGMEWCTEGRRAVQAKGATLGELWQNLHVAQPELMRRLSLEQGPPSFWVRIFVDGRLIDAPTGMDTRLSDGSAVVLRVLPGSGPAAGACGPPPDAASPGQASCR